MQYIDDMGTVANRGSSDVARPGSLEEEAREILERIRDSFSSMIETLGDQARAPQEVARALGVHRKLGWQVAHVAYDPDPFLAAQYVPSRSGMRTLIRAAAERGVPQSIIDSALEAVHAFDKLSEVHAGDRASLEMLLVASAARPDERAHLSFRASAFAGNSFIWRVQARTESLAMFLHPSAEPGWFDMARLRSVVGLRRNSPDAAWVLARTKVVDGDWQSLHIPDREPLDPNCAAESGVPLIRQFCSQPLASFRRVQGAHGFVEDELIEGPVGERGATTVVYGEVLRRVAATVSEVADGLAEYALQLRTPCEMLQFDLFVHRSLFPGVAREIVLYGEMHGCEPRAERDRLSIFEQVEHLGRGTAAIHTAAVPNYSTMVRFVYDRLGWDGRDFDLYRVSMAYPPIPSCAVIRHPMPTRETSSAPPSGGDHV